MDKAKGLTMVKHKCMISPLCKEMAEQIGTRDNLTIYRCEAGHEFACNPSVCLSHDSSEREYMFRRNQARMEGWCVRDGFKGCDCPLCKQLH